MAGGLRYDSLADMPEGMRKQVAGKMLMDSAKRQDLENRSQTEADKQSAPEWLCKQMNIPKQPAPAKYHNVETVVNGIRFQSLKEARRYEYLCRAMELGVIENLRLQEDFTLQEGYTTPTGERIRAIRYKADFTYKVRSAGYDHVLQLDMADIEYWRGLYPGAVVIEDTKTRGTRTKEYKIKRKLMADKGYTIREV